MRYLRFICSLVVVTFFCCNHTDAYRIFSICGNPNHYQVALQESLAKELARRGHHVTMISPYSSASSLENYRVIKTPISEEGKRLMESIRYPSHESSWSLFPNLPALTKVYLDTANESLNHPEVQRIIREEKFDLIIVPMVADFLLGLRQILDAPAIVVCTNSVFGYINDMVGNPNPIAAVPSDMLISDGPMTLFGRVANILCWALESLSGFYVYYMSGRYYYLNFPSSQFHDYDDVRKNVSLLLVNRYFTKTVPRPNVPAVVDVSGLQFRSKPDPLPQDLQDWIDGAEDGIILFNLFCNIQSSSMPRKKLNAVLNTLKNLKQRVVFQWDREDLPDKPSNVLLRSWLPQDDILAQPNVRLFVTNGELESVTQAHYHGVPLVGIPFLKEQRDILSKAQTNGWAVIVDYVGLTEQKFSEAIDEVLRNSRYTDTVKELSQLFRDRPMTALDTAVFWAEYVIRHEGALHMRYPGVDLNFFQLKLLDVLAALCLIMFCFMLSYRIASPYVNSRLEERRRRLRLEFHRRSSPEIFHDVRPSPLRPIRRSPRFRANLNRI